MTFHGIEQKWKKKFLTHWYILFLFTDKRFKIFHLSFCRNKCVGPTSTLYRIYILFCTSYNWPRLGPSSYYTQHYCIAWRNILNLTFCTNVSPSKTKNKTFCVCHHITTSFFPSQGQRWDIAKPFAKLTDILSVAPHFYTFHSLNEITDNFIQKMINDSWRGKGSLR